MIKSVQEFLIIWSTKQAVVKMLLILYAILWFGVYSVNKNKFKINKKRNEYNENGI